MFGVSDVWVDTLLEDYYLLMLKVIPLSELQVGMYVERVVKQSGNVTVKSRGLIKTPKLLEVLAQKGIQVVEVNFEKSNIDTTASAVDEPSNATESSHTNTQEEPQTTSEQLNEVAVKHGHKELETEQVERASTLYNHAKEIQKNFVKQLRSGNTPDFSQLNNLSQDIIDSVFDNGEALSCLMMLKDADDYLVEHALNCSILLAMFANHRGFSQADIEDLTQAGLLMDIGMASMPAELLQKRDSFTAADWTLMKSHIDIGLELVERFADLPPIVYDVIQNHHERIDGSGYPKEKTGDELSEYSQMAAIVDSYDAMISERGYKCSDHSTQTLQKLLADPSLNRELVVEFTNAIGLHPLGSLVRLNSDKLAIISKRNPVEPLEPVVMAFYHVHGRVHTDIERIDLSQVDDHIVSGIRPEEFAISLPNFFKKAFSPVA